MAQWKIWFACFIVTLVLFLLSVGAFFVVYTRNQELQKRLAQAVREKQAAEEERQDLFEELRNLKILVVGRERAEGGFPSKDQLEELRTDHLAVAEKAINAALKDLGMEAVSFSSLIEPYDQLDRIFRAYQRLRDDAVAQLKACSEKLKTTIDTTQEEVANLRQQLQNCRSEVAQWSDRWESLQQTASAEKQRLTEEIERLQEQMTDKEVELTREVQRWKNQHRTLSIRLAKLEEEIRKEKTFDEVDPDGYLVDVSPTLGKGWINLGRRDHLMTGLPFRVYRRLKGGKKLDKGMVEVRRVAEDYAEVQIVEEYDPIQHPITAGDLISSPFYDREEKPIFVFAGQLESRDYTMEFLRAKLETYGVEIRPTVDIHTSFLVALKDYEATPEYRAAQTLGVPILRERDLLEFIGD